MACAKQYECTHHAEILGECFLAGKIERMCGTAISANKTGEWKNRTYDAEDVCEGGLCYVTSRNASISDSDGALVTIVANTNPMVVVNIARTLPFTLVGHSSGLITVTGRSCTVKTTGNVVVRIDGDATADVSAQTLEIIGSIARVPINVAVIANVTKRLVVGNVGGSIYGSASQLVLQLSKREQLDIDVKSKTVINITRLTGAFTPEFEAVYYGAKVESAIGHAIGTTVVGWLTTIAIVSWSAAAVFFLE
jgi:hypothetical protein